MEGVEQYILSNIEKYLKIEEIAKILGFSRKTIYDWSMWVLFLMSDGQKNGKNKKEIRTN